MADAEDPAGSQVPEEDAVAVRTVQTNFEEFGLSSKSRIKEKYVFWETQPVAQFSEKGEAEDGPIDAPKSVSDVRQEPYNLPESFEWCTCDFQNEAVLTEVYELLSHNYVEDDDNMFRFNYSPAFLKWALLPPEHKVDWLIGVRVKSNQKLVGFISAIPAQIRVNNNVVPMVEINFLCVHKKLRSKRLAPVLIKEITRRVNLCDVWQAVYTAGVVIPKPLATCRYWHRSLNPKKLIEIGFSRLGQRMTLARTIKFYKLPDATATPRLRKMEQTDVPQVHKLLNDYLDKYKIAQVFTEAEVAHMFRPQDYVIDAYVVDDEQGVITDMLSFYTLPSSILGHPEHTELRAAYMYYVVPNATPLKQLMSDALILAKKKNYDVFNALDLLQNVEFLKDAKFGIGDGQLHYYLYNWRVKAKCTPQEVGLILM